MYSPRSKNQDERAVKARPVLGALENVPKVYMLLCRHENARLLSDKQIILKL